MRPAGRSASSVPLWRAVAVAVLLSGLLAGCGSSDKEDANADKSTRRITLWSLEFQPDRLRATQANLAAFTRRTRIAVDLVPIGDDELPARMARARSSGKLPDVAQLPLDSLHQYAREDLLDAGAAQDVLERLDDATFSQTALTLASQDSQLVGVPSDGWGQLLIYRTDLFERAGLPPPATLDDVARAARRLQGDGRAGITLPDTADENFTAEIFEHIALAAGCELVDERGAVTIASPACRKAFDRYVRLARRGVTEAGATTRDTARDRYFAGQSAMIFWSPFLLDALAGLSDEVKPTCPECRADPEFLARHSGLVGSLSDGADGAPAQYGSISSWGIFRGGDVDAARRLVQYMLSDGYMRWLALSPQGKFPVRAGDATDPERFYKAWEGLESGVARKAPLRRFYPEEAIASLGDGVRALRRWAFQQGQAALAGAVRERQAISKAVADAVAGRITPAEAAERVRRDVERLQAAER